MSAQTALFDEIATRERILGYYEQNHPAYLSHIRAIALDLARSRWRLPVWNERIITIDDVHAQMRAMKTPFPKDFGADERLLGNALRGCKGLRAVGQRTTTNAARVARSGIGRGAVTEYVYHPETDPNRAARS